MRDLDKGCMVWIPCEVKSGPFSNERVIRVESDNGESYVFVSTSFLRDSVTEGMTFVRAVILEIQDKIFTARLPGLPLNNNWFVGQVQKVRAGDTLQA